MKKIIFLCISVIIGILVNQKSEEIIIPSDAIRMRIIANSNDIKDLYEKEKLKKEIEKEVYDLVSNSNNITNAREIIRDNLEEIKKIIGSKVKNYNIKYGNNYFPKKIYKGIVYPEGEYESLIITIGKGLGENWWCVLYPPLCLINDNDTTSDVEYRSLVLDILQN